MDSSSAGDPERPRSPLLSGQSSKSKKRALSRTSSVQFTLPGFRKSKRKSRLEETSTSPLLRASADKGSSLAKTTKSEETTDDAADQVPTPALRTKSEEPSHAGAAVATKGDGDKLMTLMKDTSLLQQAMAKLEQREEEEVKQKQVDLASLKLSMVGVARLSFSDDSDVERLSSRSSGDEGPSERPRSPLAKSDFSPGPSTLDRSPGPLRPTSARDAHSELTRSDTGVQVRRNSMDVPPVPPRQRGASTDATHDNDPRPTVDRAASTNSPCRAGRFGRAPVPRSRMPKPPVTPPSALGLRLSRQPSATADEPVSQAATELTKRLMQRSALSGTTLFRSRRLTVTSQEEAADNGADGKELSSSPISAVQVEMMTFQRRLEAQDSESSLEDTLAAAGVGEEEQRQQLLTSFKKTLKNSWKLDLFKQFLRTSHLDAALSFYIECEEYRRLCKQVETFEEQALCTEVAFNTCKLYKGHEDLEFIRAPLKEIFPKIRENRELLESMDTTDLPFDRTFGLPVGLFEQVQRQVMELLVFDEFPKFLCSHNTIRTTPQVDSPIGSSSDSMSGSVSNNTTFSLETFNDFGSGILSEPTTETNEGSARPLGLFSLVRESLCGGKLSIDAQFGEEDKPENILYSTSRGGKRQVDAATHGKLIERLTDAACVDSDFQFACISCALYFTDSHLQFLQLLRCRFKSVTTPPLDLITEQQQADYKRRSIPTVIKIATVLKIFIDLHHKHLRNDTAFRKFLDVFISTEVYEVMPSIHKNIKAFVEKKLDSEGEEVEEEFQFDTKPPKVKVSRSLLSAKQEDIGILMVHPLEAARQLTILDHELFRKILPCECVTMNWTKEEKEALAPNVLANIRQFCNLSLFVGHSIVTVEDMTKRTQTLGRFIKIAYECLRLGNLNSAMAIVSGLQNHPVYRLKCTWAKLLDKCWDLWEELKDVFKCDENFAALRAYLRGISPPAVPYLGMYLSDLTFIDNEKNFIDREKRMVNFAKMQYVSAVVLQIQQYQQAAYCLEPVDVLQRLFRNMPTSTDAELYKLSVQRESKAFQAAYKEKPKKRISFFKSKDKAK